MQRLARLVFVVLTLAHALVLQPGARAAEAPAARQEQSAAQGSLVIIGGNLHVENTAVWERIVRQAGGRGAKIAVIPAASASPMKSGNAIAESLGRAGAEAFVVPVSVKLEDVDYRKVVADPEVVARVRAAGGVYFAGGDQGRITRALRTADGRNTPLLDAIWEVYRKGGVIAGSSAGAAIMSSTMFYDARPVLPTLKFGVTEGKEIAPGLGFIGPDIFVDQHLLIRGRFARMLPAMLARGYKLGLGVDENTAMVISGRRELEVIGYKGILVVDLSEATTDPALGAFNIRDAKLSYLDRGDRYDLVTKAFTPAKEKAGGRVDPARPYFSEARFYPDILANTVVADLMQELVDSRQTEAVGLAFGGPGDAKPELGFEFRFRKTPQTAGWFTSAFGGEDYSVLNIALDVRPVLMQWPLYRAFPPLSTASGVPR